MTTTPVRLLTNSECADAKRCRRRWYLRWHLNLTPLREDTWGPRAIGNRVHGTLAVKYDPAHPDDETAEAEAWAWFENSANLDRSIALGDPAEGVPSSTPSEIKEMESDIDLARVMIAGYFEWLAEEGADEWLEVVSAESEHSADLAEVNGRLIRLVEKLDLKVRDREQDTIRFLDHKTTDAFGRLTPTLHIVDQFKHYQLVDRLTVAEGERAGGAIINMIRKTKRTATAKPPFFMRKEVAHNDDTLRAHFIALVALASLMTEMEDRLAGGEDHHAVCFPSPKPECSWDCDFFQLCPLMDDGSPTELLISGMFQQRDGLAGRYNVQALLEGDPS